MRLHDWQTRLEALVSESQHLPFAWGKHDCVLWAASVVHAITGDDPAADIRGTYDSALGAAKLIRKHDAMSALCSHRLGARIAVTMAQVGDIGLVDDGDYPMLAAWLGGAWTAPASTGLVAIDPGRVVCAWRCC